MTTRSVTKQNAALSLPDRSGQDVEKSAGSGTAHKPGDEIQSPKIVAVLLNPNCEHDWIKLADDLQTLADEGKTIWQCRTCTEVTNTYSWQTPQENT